jgi:hypothetical protein
MCNFWLIVGTRSCFSRVPSRTDIAADVIVRTCLKFKIDLLIGVPWRMLLHWGVVWALLLHAQLLQVGPSSADFITIFFFVGHSVEIFSGKRFGDLSNWGIKSGERPL